MSLTEFAQNVPFMKKWQQVTKSTQKFAQMGKIGSLDENSYDAKVMWSDQTAPMSKNCTRLKIQSRFWLSGYTFKPKAEIYNNVSSVVEF